MVVVAGRSDDRQLHLFTNRGFGIALFENMNESLTFGIRKNYGKIGTDIYVPCKSPRPVVVGSKITTPCFKSVVGYLCVIMCGDAEQNAAASNNQPTSTGNGTRTRTGTGDVT
jgi:hypothetical protein